MGTRISSRTSVVVAIIAAVLAALLGAPAAADPPDDITYYRLPDPHSGGGAIAAGPDGNMWFTDGGRIGRITPIGAITEYPLPAESDSDGIAAGPDGNMWFTELAGNRIGRITPTGEITEYPLPTVDSGPHGIAAGPDGNMWFTTGTNDGDGDSMIGRITPRGWITVLPSSATDIAAGPDGNLWFTTTNAGIGRIAPTATLMVVKRACPVRMTLHMPTPRKIGSRVFTDRIMTKKSSCVLRKPVVRVRREDPWESTSGAKKPVFDTKISKYGKIRVITKGHGDLYVTVIVRAYPKRGFADRWKRGTWRKTWYLWRL